MKDWKSQSHVRWDCKYHVVFISKYRQRVIYGKVRTKVGGIIRDLCQQKGVELLEDNKAELGIEAFSKAIERAPEHPAA